MIATTEYEDTSLRQLRSPARDAAELSEILVDPEIGGFEVTQVLDGQAEEIRLSIEDYLADRLPADLLLVYLSCHGLVDARRQLFFAATNTRKDRLAATGIRSDWLMEQMEDCRARRQVIILDCCFSGAFAKGVKGDTDLDLGGRFQRGGRGRIVLTASRGSEYSFEGERISDSAGNGSVFTTALIEGIRSGAADKDSDGYISVDEAYAYAFSRVQEANAKQTPQRWAYGAEGDILLARSPAGLIVSPAILPDAMRSGLESPYPDVRLGAVRILGEWLSSATPGNVLVARSTLIDISENDIPRVAEAARALLPTAGSMDGPPRPPASLKNVGAGLVQGHGEGDGQGVTADRQIQTPVTVPLLGDSIPEGTVMRWLKKVGDQVVLDEPLLELSTDKIDSEIPAPASGVLTEINIPEGQTVPVGTVIAVITRFDGSGGQARIPESLPSDRSSEITIGAAGEVRRQHTQITLVVPPLGESISEGTVTRWLRKVGDQVVIDEPLLELSTDKIDTEIPAPATGSLTEIYVAAGQKVAIGTKLAVIVSHLS